MKSVKRVSARARLTGRGIWTQSLADAKVSFRIPAIRWHRKISRTSYSQFGEDKILRSLLPETFGSYLEIGAGDPIRNSNTYLFYVQGWRGTLVEPIPSIFEKLKKVRPRDQAVNRAIVGPNINQDQIDFWEFTPTELSTSDNVRAQYLIDHNTHLTGKYRIDTCSIMDLELSVSPDNPFLLSIDAEGLDYEILRGISWDTFRPRVICVEDPLGMSGESRIKLLLRESGYMHISQCSVSSIYLHADSFAAPILDHSKIDN